MKKIKRVIVMGIVLLFGFSGSFQNKGIVLLSIDPRMLLNGPYEDSTGGELNFVVRAGVTNFKNEMGVSFESFSALDYRGYEAFYNYKFFTKKIENESRYFEFLGGVASGVVTRPKQDVSELTLALNAESRYYFSKNWGLSITGNYRYRGDLVEMYDASFSNYMVFSGYFGVLFRW
jgi:hypothetical protein